MKILLFLMLMPGVSLFAAADSDIKVQKDTDEQKEVRRTRDLYVQRHREVLAAWRQEEITHWEARIHLGGFLRDLNNFEQRIDVRDLFNREASTKGNFVKLWQQINATAERLPAVTPELVQGYCAAYLVRHNNIVNAVGEGRITAAQAFNTLQNYLHQMEGLGTLPAIRELLKSDLALSADWQQLRAGINNNALDLEPTAIDTDDDY